MFGLLLLAGLVLAAPARPAVSATGEEEKFIFTQVGEPDAPYPADIKQTVIAGQGALSETTGAAAGRVVVEIESRSGSTVRLVIALKTGSHREVGGGRQISVYGDVVSSTDLDCTANTADGKPRAAVFLLRDNGSSGDAMVMRIAGCPSLKLFYVAPSQSDTGRLKVVIQKPVRCLLALGLPSCPKPKPLAPSLSGVWAYQWTGCGAGGTGTVTITGTRLHFQGHFNGQTNEFTNDGSLSVTGKNKAGHYTYDLKWRRSVDHVVLLTTSQFSGRSSDNCTVTGHR
jgi:hypothetical protein